MHIAVRPLQAEDLTAADRIMRLAFGTFAGLADPMSYMGDGSSVRPRWHTDPRAAFAVDVDGRLAGSNFVTQWGSFAFFGPLSIHPDYWGRGLAHHLMAPVMDRLSGDHLALAGLFTFAHSLKHIGLYQKYGFRPRMLTTLFEKQVSVKTRPSGGFAMFSGLDERSRVMSLETCRRLTQAVFDGLDLTTEIQSLDRQKLGDMVILRNADGETGGFALCHHGAGSEGGSDTCYVKFAVAQPGQGAAKRFAGLLDAVCGFARHVGAMRVIAGVNAGRREAYEMMLSKGFCPFRTGVAMHRPNRAGFSRPGVWVMDDWR